MWWGEGRARAGGISVDEGGGQDWKSPCTEGTLHGEVQYIMDNGHIGSYPEQNYTHDSKHYLPTTLLAGGKMHFFKNESGIDKKIATY